MLILPVPCLFDNFSYLIGCPETRECAVVDPSEYYPVYTAIEKNGMRLTTVLCTHHHRDHLDGLEDLLADYPEVEVVGYSADQGRQPLVNKPVTDGDVLTVGKIEGTIHHTPGHTTGSCVYYFKGALFTGDTVFGAGCGRLFEGTAEQMFQSIKRIQELFAPETSVYPGHNYTLANLKFASHLEPANLAVTTRMQKVGQEAQENRWEPSTIGLEQMTNPFFRCEEKLFQAAMERFGFAPSSAPVELFALIRKLKDNF